MRLQKARAHLFDRVVAAREQNAQAAIVRRQRHEVGKRVARCLLEQALDAFDKDDLAILRTEDGAKFRPVRRHLRGGQRGVQMRLREFLDAKAKQEMIQGEHADGVLAHGRLAAAGRSHHEHDLSVLERVEDFLHECRASQMKIAPERRAYCAQDGFGVIAKRLEHAAVVGADHAVARQRGGGQVIAAQAATGNHRRARLYDQLVPGSAGARHGVSVRRREGEHAPDVRFRLSRRAVEVEAQHVESAQERPDVGCRDEFSFDVADDFLQLAAVAHGRVGDEAFGGEPLLELDAATRRPRAIEEPDEVLEKRIRTAQRDKREAVVVLRKVRGVARLYLTLDPACGPRWIAQVTSRVGTGG